MAEGVLSPLRLTVAIITSTVGGILSAVLLEGGKIGAPADGSLSLGSIIGSPIPLNKHTLAFSALIFFYFLSNPIDDIVGSFLGLLLIAAFCILIAYPLSLITPIWLSHDHFAEIYFVTLFLAIPITAGIWLEDE